MTKLTLRQNHLTYHGVLARPPMRLWGEGKQIVGGLLEALQPFGVDIASFRENQGTRLADQGVEVILGKDFSYRFTFGGTKLEIANFTSDELAQTAKLLDSTDTWLRAADPEMVYNNHLYAYGGHFLSDLATSEDLLRAMSDRQIPELGSNRGTALTFHANRPSDGGRVQLLIDHSLVVRNGLFLQFILTISQDVVRHRAVVQSNTELFKTCLAAVGLDIEGI